MYVGSDPTPRAPDGWVRAAFSGTFLGSNQFRQSGVIWSHLPTGNYRILHKHKPLGIVEYGFIG
jgi:hypothetical protein